MVELVVASVVLRQARWQLCEETVRKLSHSGATLCVQERETLEKECIQRCRVLPLCVVRDMLLVVITIPSGSLLLTALVVLVSCLSLCPSGVLPQFQWFSVVWPQ